MEVIILGENSDDKGTQLEKLTEAILKNLGYTDVSTSEIGAGGFELDVTAEFLQPGIGNNTKRLTICECKAHRKSISTTDWMKFLGKIFTHELGGKHVDGCFIALNGANGNVKGQYRALREKRQDINLISGDDLYRIFGQLYQLSAINEIQYIIESLTTRKVLTTSICYYQEALYWLVVFIDNNYTLLDNSGKSVKDDGLLKLQGIISDTMDFADYVDLNSEKEQRTRSMLVEKYIISMFLIFNTRMELDEILRQCNAKHGRFPVDVFYENEVYSALKRLIEKGIVIYYKKKYNLKAFAKSHTQEDVTNMFHIFFDEKIVILALGSIGYNKLINEKLLNEIGKIQGNLVIPQDKKKDWIKILKWSPSALGWAIHPDQMIVGHRFNNFGITDNVDATDITYFNQKLSSQLSQDFTHQVLADYFFNICGIVELETEQIMKVKSTQKILTQLEYKERIKLGRFVHEEFNQVIAIRMLTEQPEPWEEPFNSSLKE